MYCYTKYCYEITHNFTQYKFSLQHSDDEEETVTTKPQHQNNVEPGTTDRLLPNSGTKRGGATSV